jgi:glycosyltransferase involved in cell wall biosynthesis
MLTVLMTTYNGASTLPEVMAAYGELEPPAGGWKVVVVDNGSIDATPQILDAFRSRLPLQVLREDRRGQNAARNAGIPHVEGDLLVMSDDDTLPSRGWLTALRGAADAQPDFTIFGGPILPRWPAPPPRWVLDWVPLSATYAALPPAKEGPAPPRRAFGPNVTLRTKVFADGRRFDETIGPKGRDYPMGAETEFLIRLGEEGARAWHCAGAVVHHIVRDFQLSRQWVLERAHRFGRGQYRLEARGWPTGPTYILGRPRHLLWRVARQHLRVAHARLRRRPEESFRSTWWLKYLQGQMTEARIMMRYDGRTASPR